MAELEFKAFFDFEDLKPAKAFAIVKSVLFPELSGQVGHPEILKAQGKIKVLGTGALPIQFGGIEFDVGHVGHYALDWVSVKSSVLSLSHYDQLALSLSTEPAMVMAYVVNYDYDHWQNAEDPLHYTSKGKEYRHLPMKSNELPYPLEQKIIDISQNPGRWRWRRGFVEIVASVLWVAEPFWRRSYANKERILNADWLKVTQPNALLTRIESYPEFFSSANGEQGNIQRRLRELLYPLAQQ
jgi:hypothetical protein